MLCLKVLSLLNPPEQWPFKGTLFDTVHAVKYLGVHVDLLIRGLGAIFRKKRAAAILLRLELRPAGLFRGRNSQKLYILRIAQFAREGRRLRTPARSTFPTPSPLERELANSGTVPKGAPTYNWIREVTAAIASPDALRGAGGRPLRVTLAF